MKLLLLVLVNLAYLCLGDRRIVSRPIQSTYNQYGKADNLIIQWKTYEPVYIYDYLKITLPQIIHDPSLVVSFNLRTAHSLNILSSQTSLPYVGSNTYYLPIMVNLTANVWYQLQLTLGKSLTIVYGLVQMEVVSQAVTPMISYCWNNGFQYYHLQQTAVPSLSILSLNINNSLSLSTLAADRYQVLLQVKSSISINQSVNITFDFVDFNISAVNLTVNTAVSGAAKGFTFIGSCFAKCDYADVYHTCIQSTQCSLNTTSITITLPYMRANEIYLIETFIVNPPYVSSVWLQAYWRDNSGKTIGLTFANTMLSVSPITVQPEQIRLLWNIPYNTVVTQMGLGLFVNDPALQHQSLSTFDIGFSVSDVTPIQGQYEVRITVGAASVNQLSINHNLPSMKTTTKITCRYVMPKIICTGVDAFVLKNYRYFVRARGNFLTTSNIAAFGNVQIYAVNQPANLFVNLVRGLVVHTVVNSDYHDYGGLHQGTSNFRIGQSMVVSHNDTMLPNSTIKSIQDFFYSADSLVGVDASITPQQLLFFLKVPLASMSLPSPNTQPQNYTMNIFTNPNIMNSSALGIDFVGYSAVNNTWDVAYSTCYVDSSTTPTMQYYMCQKYNDHVYGRQIDNTFTKTNNYGLYKWVCGNGQAVVCNTSDCSSACQIFKGGFRNGAMTTGTAGVLSLRNVTFTNSYQSPIEAGPNNFDFVLTFYQAGVLVSASLINAYTMNKTRLSYVRGDLVNYYNDNVVTNIGNRLPTMLKISGYLSLTELGRKPITAMRVHIPNVLSITNFIETNNFNRLGCSTQNCIATSGGVATALDTWVSQTVIQIRNLPSLTQAWTVLFPVVYQTPSQLLQITVSFVESDGMIGGVYRINGSAVFQNLVGSLNYIALPWTPINAWVTTLSQWVNQPANYTFKQAIDLPSIYPFSPMTTINMNSTVMPVIDAFPSTTFTSSYLPIFSNYTYPTVDLLPNKCVDPFPYTFMNGYTIWVLWCAVQAGSLNQIIINYPIYQPEFFGAGFPYSMVFAYSYSNTKGNMIGYRVDQNVGGTPQTCSTQKSTTYDKNSVNPQQNQYMTTFTPFTLRVSPRKKALITLSLPAQVPMTALSCRAQQPNQNVDLGCSIFSQLSNTFKLEVSYLGQSSLSVYSIRLILRTVKSATATISTIQLFNMTVSLPFTDTGTSLPSFTGTGYTPYVSLIASCSNSFTYSSVSSSQYIYLSSPVLQGISAGYYGTLTFNVVFSNSRTILFDSSTLIITFSQAILTQYSRCELQPNSHFFMTSSIDVSNKIMTLTPKRNIADFTLISYVVRCSKIVPSGNNITISMQWKDGAYTLQNTFANIIAIHPPINTAYSTFTTTLTSKLYSSPGYLAQYTFNLAVPVNGQKIGIWVDFGNSHIHQQFVQAEVTMGVTSNWGQVIAVIKLDQDVQSALYIEFFAGIASSIQIRIYGVLQTHKAPPTIKLLIKKQSLITGISSYLTSSVVDIAPTDITAAPIQILAYSINPQSYVTITYTLPVTYSGVYYVRMDQLFRTSSSDTYTCTINGSAVGCWRVRPDLIYVNNTITHNIGLTTTLQIGVLNYWSSQAYDNQEVRFSIFITPSTRSYVLYGSHQHVQNILLTSSLNPPQSLVWSIAPNQYNSVAQVVNIGYYSQPAQLMTFFSLPFIQSFTYNTSMSFPTLFSILDLNAELGTSADITYIGTYNSSLLGYRNLIFTHTSPYSRIYSLPIFVSATKCQLIPQFPIYNIVSGGVTIPIAINVSQCKPMQSMNVSTAVNSPYISADTSLSTKVIDMSSDVIYIVLNHQLISGTVGLSYQLQVFLNSANTVVNNAYLSIPNITIKVMDSALLIGNPQAKQPIVNSITESSINLSIQCNTPATIYWGAGLYPTMLGISVEEIQARLIQQNNGLVNNNIDIYSWSHEQYGLNYVNDFNIVKNLTVTGLQGGIDYVFKYYCVDQTGKASGGKITLFTTMASNYSLMKITLSFSSVLNYSQVNSIACAISQTLIIPYNQTISSVHSNCINSSQIYYYSWSTYYDQKSSLLIGNGQPYLYFFYVQTNRVTSRMITSNLASNLGNNKVFQNSTVPYFGSMRADALLNAYEPVINNIGIQISRTEFTITATIGLQNTYLIAAIMDGHFNPVTQSLPTHYLMKEGFFSAGTKFDQIFSIYGRESLSITFKGLSQGQNISVFYFTTVDNSAINSRNSDVMYQDIVTNIRQIIDLWSNYYRTAIFALCLTVLLMLH